MFILKKTKFFLGLISQIKNYYRCNSLSAWNKKFLVIAMILLFPIMSYADSGGTFGAGFENIGHTAFISAGRAIIKNGIEALHYNPALAAADKNAKVCISATVSKLYNEFDGIKYSEFDMIYPYSNIDWALSYSALNVDDLREANSIGLTGSTFDAKYELLKFGVSKSYKNNVRYGISSDYYRTAISSYSLTNLTLNIGGSYKKNNFQINGLLQNIFSTSSTAVKESEKMPLNVEITGQYEIMEYIILGAALNKKKDCNLNLRFGIECRIFPALSVSAGYISSSKLPSFGISAELSKIRCHYGLTKHKDLDISHRISVDAVF